MSDHSNYTEELAKRRKRSQTIILGVAVVIIVGILIGVFSGSDEEVEKPYIAKEEPAPQENVQEDTTTKEGQVTEDSSEMTEVEPQIEEPTSDKQADAKTKEEAAAASAAKEAEAKRRAAEAQKLKEEQRAAEKAKAQAQRAAAAKAEKQKAEAAASKAQAQKQAAEKAKAAKEAEAKRMAAQKAKAEKAAAAQKAKEEAEKKKQAEAAAKAKAAKEAAAAEKAKEEEAAKVRAAQAAAAEKAKSEAKPKETPKSFRPEDKPMPKKVTVSKEAKEAIAKEETSFSDKNLQSATSDYKLGLNAYQAKNYKNAIKALSKVPKPESKQRGNPKRDEYVRANFYKGLSLQKVGGLKEAVSAYQQVLKYEKYHPICNMNLGICYLELKQFAKADKAFKNVIRDQNRIPPTKFDDVMQRSRYFWALAWTRLAKSTKSADKKKYYKKQANLKWSEYIAWYGKEKKYEKSNKQAQLYIQTLQR